MNYSYSSWEPKRLFDNLLNPDPRDLKRHSISEEMDSELIGRSSGEYPTAEPVNHPIFSSKELTESQKETLYPTWKPLPLMDVYKRPTFDDSVVPVIKENHLKSVYMDLDDWRDGLPSAKLKRDGDLWIDISTGKKYLLPPDSVGSIPMLADSDIAEYGKHCTLRMKRYEQMVSPAAVLLSTKVPNLIKRLMKKG